MRGERLVKNNYVQEKRYVSFKSSLPATAYELPRRQDFPKFCPTRLQPALPTQRYNPSDGAVLEATCA